MSRAGPGHNHHPDHLENAARRQRIEIRGGDVVLLRTGLAQHFEDARRFASLPAGPGPEIDGARWLSSRGIFAAGSDTMALRTSQ